MSSCFDTAAGHRHIGRTVDANDDLRVEHVEDLQQLLDADGTRIRFNVGHARLSDSQQLRESGRRIWLVVNKTEGLEPTVVNAEFHELALGEPLAIAAAHGKA